MSDQDDSSRAQVEPSTSTSGTDLVPFWTASSRAAAPLLSSIRSRLPHFPSPTLRVQRVNQLDAELLDQELVAMLLEPLKGALQLIKATLPTDFEPELFLLLRLALFKFSIYDRGATYGAMLQNLRYRNEWKHKGGHRPLSALQLTLHPTLTILLPYAHTRLSAHMTSLSYSDMPSRDLRRRLWELLNRVQRWWAAAVLINFGVFLGDGKYRTLTDRLLGMRLTYAQRTMNRNVSFEFLNRQLVWHAFTEFLLFLWPLIRPRRLLRKLTRLPAHPRVLSAALRVLPAAASSRLGITRDASGRPKLQKLKTGASDDATGGRGKYWALPPNVCAICWEQMEDAASTATGMRGGLRMGIPSSDPLDPSSGALAPTSSSGRSSTTGRGNATRDPAPTTSASGLAYADALVHNAYEARPCGDLYCYYCITEKLLSEDMADELADGDGWECLRCAKAVRAARRWEGGVVLGEQLGEGEGEDEEAEADFESGQENGTDSADELC